MGKRNIPEIRFKGFDGEWEEKILGEICSVNRGIRVTRKELNDEGKYPVYQNTDYPMGYFSQYNVDEKNPFVIIGGSAGLIGYSEKKFWAADDCAYFGDSKNIEKRFLFNLLLNNNDYIKKNIRGSSVPRLDRKVIIEMNIKIPMKDFSEQNRIANLFTALDKQISVSEAKLEKLRVIKKTLLKKMFAASGEKTPEIRFKGFEGEWEEKKMGEIENATYSKGNGYSKNCLADNGTPIILYGRLYTNYQTEITTINTFVKNILTNSVYSNGGEIIIPASGETAEDIAIAATVKEKGILLGGDLNIIKPNKDIFNSIFLSLGISNGKTKKILSSYAQGKSVVHLHNTDIQKINISIPTLTEQSQIANLFTTLDKQISIQEQKIDKLRAVKNTLLKKMFV